MNATPASNKGLPGFLRRSIRTPTSQNFDNSINNNVSDNDTDSLHDSVNNHTSNEDSDIQIIDTNNHVEDNPDEIIAGDKSSKVMIDDNYVQQEDDTVMVNRKFRLSLSFGAPSSDSFVISYDDDDDDDNDNGGNHDDNAGSDRTTNTADNNSTTENERSNDQISQTHSKTNTNRTSSEKMNDNLNQSDIPQGNNTSNINNTNTSPGKMANDSKSIKLDSNSTTIQNNVVSSTSTPSSKNNKNVNNSNNMIQTPNNSKIKPSSGGIVTDIAVGNNNNNNDTTKIKSYKEKEFDKVMSQPVVDISQLRKLSWNGIPREHRPLIWKILLGYLPTNSSRRSQTLKRKRSEYADAIKQHYDIDDNTRTLQEQETLRQVLVDVPRTAPDVGLFRNDLIKQSLARLLYIWAMRHPASSYVQGINDLATPLIAVFLSEYCDVSGVRDGYRSNTDGTSDDVLLTGQFMEDLSADVIIEVEADVYWCLTNLLAGIQDHYTSDQPGVQRMVMRLEELIHRMDNNLTEHLRNTGIEFMQFAFKWMNCLLLREFSLKRVIRLWDTYLSEGDGGFETFHVYVCAALLCQFSNEVQTMEFDELFGFMQNVPTAEWGDGEIEILLSQAFILSTLFEGSEAHLTPLTKQRAI